MTSSMLTGERRWTSTRRGGMTVLGKVAVPKPINLPSQRLENHGLDPNVEIVPKGTLSWGNKSTSSATNAWGSSSVSPNTESASSSPSHLCGRPSSAGGGTRPSTAGSDRSHEPHGNAWGPSSRPSSASGPVTLNHASLASLRPQSAETKSSSSQLSRFAETSENPVAWNSAVTTEKVGTMPCKSDGFSLTSGDFPTLGSEKECVGKGAESQDNMSNGGATMKEMTGTSAMDDPENVTASVYTLRSDNLPHNDEGSRPNAEKWVGHPQPYPGANIPPPRYDGWHGSPVNNPQGGVWYRGPPQGGPPYRTPVAPGNFPMDPFLYYPQIPPGGLPNPHAPHGTGPRGPHPNTGDIYRPPMHDGFIHPGVSIRPGFYPGPVTYEGYYRPPMGYCNSNDRDAPFMGMPAGPSGPSGPAGPAGPAVYNRHLGLGKSASEPASSHGLSSGHGSSGKALVPEQVESDLPCDNQGPYKVLMQQGNLNGKNEEEENRVNPTTTNQLILEKADQQRASPWENDWDHKKEVDARKRTFGVEPFAQASASHKAQSSENIEGKSCGSMRTGDGLLEKSDAAASGFSEVLKSLAPATKDSSLIQKIEGLNAKARASDVRHDDALISSREESNELQSKDKHSDHFFAHEAGVSTVLPQNRDFNEVIDPASCELSLSTGDRNVKLYSGAPVHRRSNRGMQGRNDHHGRGKVNTQEVEGWHKRPILDSPGMIATPQESSVLARDHSALGAIDKAESFPSDSHGDVPAPSVGDSKDSQAQRTKMRELAKQRTKQLQEEEEERTRKQKARALAKLEELNRRTVAGEGPTQWSENASNDAIRNKIEEPRNVGNPRTIDMISGEHNTVSDLHVVANNSESTMGTNKNSPIVSENTSSKNQSSGNKEKVVAPIESRPIEQDAAQNKNVSEVNGGGASLKHKRTGNKQKPNTPSDKTEKLPHLVKESKSQTVVADIHSVVEESSNVTTDPVAESSTPTRKKHNKSGKNKHKVEEASISTSLPQVSKEATPTTEYDKQTASQSVMNPPSDPQLPINRDDNQFNLQQPLLPVVETHGKGNGQWKSQHSRRMPRNAQNKPGEKIHGGDSVVWAPVRSLNKCEVSIEAVQKNEAEAVASSVKIDNQVQNIPKNKRAEREIYVPKPVAKEMAQQGTFHQDFSPMNQAPDDNKADSSSQSSDNTRSSVAASGMGFSTDHRNGDGRHHKQSKAHASWRQRGATEYGQGLQDQSSYASNAGSYVKKSSEYQVPEKPAGNSTNEFVSQIDEWDPPEGWNDPNYSASIPPVTAVLGRDQGVTGRGKRSQFKGHKGIGNNYDLNERKLRSGDHEKISSESSMPEVDQKDASAAAKENRGVGERSTSHWQPKSRMVQPHNHQSRKARGDQNVDADAAQTNKTGSSLSAHGTKTSDGVAQNHEEGASVGHHGFGGDKKISSRKDRPYSPTQGPIHNAEVAPANSDVRRQQQLPSFYHKGNEINNRFGRGSESRRERNSFQYHKQQQNFPPANRNRQRQNLQYEYQPVGPHNGKPNMDRPKDNTTQHSGSRYIERGQGQSRRDGGNFYKQEGGGPV